MPMLVLQEPNHVGGKIIYFAVIGVMIVITRTVIFTPMSLSYRNQSIDLHFVRKCQVCCKTNFSREKQTLFFLFDDSIQGNFQLLVIGIAYKVMFKC